VTGATKVEVKVVSDEASQGSEIKYDEKKSCKNQELDEVQRNHQLIALSTPCQGKGC
jgi:hypothetical protein